MGILAVLVDGGKEEADSVSTVLYLREKTRLLKLRYISGIPSPS
jgi:hypothetical protein